MEQVTLANRQAAFPYFTVKDVAQRYKVHRSTVLRWIEKGLPAVFATREQLGQLIALELLRATPTHEVYLIPKEHLDEKVAQARAYPEGTTRKKRGSRSHLP